MFGAPRHVKGITGARSLATGPGQACAISGFGGAAGCAIASKGKISPDVHPHVSLFYALKRNDFKLNRYVALASFLSIIFSENWHPLFRIMLEAIANQMAWRALAPASSCDLHSRLVETASARRGDGAARRQHDPVAVPAFDHIDPPDTGQDAASADCEEAAVATFDQSMAVLNIVNEPIQQNPVAQFRWFCRRRNCGQRSSLGRRRSR